MLGVSAGEIALLVAAVMVAGIATGILAADKVERHLRERAEHAAQLLDGGRRDAVRLETPNHAV